MENCRGNTFDGNNQQSIYEFHSMTKKAAEIFDNSANIIDCQSRKAIYDAIQTLDNAIKIEEEGQVLNNQAYELLDNSTSANLCHKNSIKCKCLYNAKSAEFAKEAEYLRTALKQLKEALNSVNRAISARNKGCELNHEYIQCVHGKDEINSNT